MHVKSVTGSKKLPHIPDIEKVEKIIKNSVQVVGAYPPKLLDKVVVNLELTALDGSQIHSYKHQISKRQTFRIST